MQSKSYLFLFVVLVLSGLSAFMYSKENYNLGLDVQGGVRIQYRMKTEDLKPDQRQRIASIRQNIIRIMSERAQSSLGVVEGNVIAKGTDQIIVELPGFTDPVKAEETMQTTAKIQYYHAKNVVTEFRPNNRYTAESDDGSKEPVVSFHLTSDPTKVIKFGDPEYKRIIEGWDLILEGDDLSSAQAQVAGMNSSQPEMFFSSDGARKMEAWCRKYFNRKENLAAVLDGKVLSIAFLRENTILKNEAVITGQFDPAYVNNLVKLLNAGSLPVDLEKLGSDTVDPTIGKTALRQIINAGTVALAILSVFMLVYYAFPGLLAIIALCLYILFTLTALKWIQATFSLAAIAGFILSVGMAVDANILVFERVKEEMRAGKALMTAIELGFKRALPAIIDSNACTLITSLVLVNLGTGPVKGFATTLIVGVLISLFTAVTVTRSLLVFLVGSGLGANEKWFALGRQWFGTMETRADHEPLRIVENSKRWFAISVLTIIPGLIFIAMGGMKFNVEFRGGYEASYAIGPSSPPQATIASNLHNAGILGSNVKFGESGGQRVAYVTVPPFADKPTDQIARERVAQASGFTLADQKSFSSVGAAVSEETKANAILGVIISSVLIVIYLAIRFGFAVGGFMNGLRFGFSAIGALVHDVFVVIGFAAIFGFAFGWEVSALFITAMLTMIGFSVHDTIVIFDRIRENLVRPHSGENFGHLVNRSITQSFARSLNTSGTVIMTLIVLIAMGTPTPDLKAFCAVMLVGIVSGTYSSIYNAAPILYLWDKASGKKHGKDGLLMEEAENAYKDALRMRADTQVSETPAPSSRTVKDASGRSYGQIKRRSSVVEQSKRSVDDD